MARIPALRNPEQQDAISASRRGSRPFLFQVLDPGFDEPLYPVMLALLVNPESFSESHSKTQTRKQSYGGYVEWQWPDELSSCSAQASTGGFMGMEAGLASGQLRHRTIAWERKQDLLELFRQNGIIYNSSGIPVLRGRILLMYDRGLFIGHFSTFEETQNEEDPYKVSLAWEFVVERSIHRFPVKI